MWQKKSVQRLYSERFTAHLRPTFYYLVRQRGPGVTSMYRVDRIKPLPNGAYQVIAGADHEPFTVPADEMLTYAE